MRTWLYSTMVVSVKFLSPLAGPRGPIRESKIPGWQLEVWRTNLSDCLIARLSQTKR